MTDLVKDAKLFATQAHQRIGHRRKYTSQPYEVHLREVGKIVSSVTDDPQMIAAAWLHDTVEDTAATHRDIEQNFGPEVGQLVRELTDVSKPSDGNRAIRKSLDREHLRQASPRAKTIKLADLIDNTRDICKHDPRFARTYYGEAIELIEVLIEGDPVLYKQAKKELSRCAEKLGLEPPPGSMLDMDDTLPTASSGFSQRRMQRLFNETFTAKDIAEPLLSFDGDSQASSTRDKMTELGIQVAGIRDNGKVVGYVWQDDLKGQLSSTHARQFGRDQLVYGDASLSDVILVLTRYEYCFISVLDAVTGVVTKAELENPIIRMWLFGMITMLEMAFATRIRAQWPNDSWVDFCSANRLRKAEELYSERHRLNQHTDLVDCLQLADKAQVLINDADYLSKFDISSKGQADKLIKSISSLRNNLAHGQSIIAYDWPQIVRMTQRLEDIIARI